MLAGQMENLDISNFRFWSLAFHPDVKDKSNTNDGVNAFLCWLVALHPFARNGNGLAWARDTNDRCTIWALIHFD